MLMAGRRVVHAGPRCTYYVTAPFERLARERKKERGVRRSRRNAER